ncbi:MAG: hypothetical protein D6681_14835 [Calditrichaeota bacterium]|nr:MAG: hypothetical protein D6681_14835 [Calditrichota bacterium]
MTAHLRFFLPLLYLAIPAFSQVVPYRVSNAAELQALLRNPVDSVEIELAPGAYHLTPIVITDSTCGNCENPDTLISATAGLVITGRYVRLSGPPDHSAIIHTHAGYGLFFRGCERGIVEHLTLTDGVRDPSPQATDAAIVVKNSAVTIRHNRIVNNIGDSTLLAQNIVGIMGICGRENSRLEITDNYIVRNSWDGIALYRDAVAEIRHNLIDGVDKATARIPGGGRGVGIGITWNARAIVEENRVTRYWKGIGIFVNARVTARRNIVEDVLTWGIAYWDAGRGKPVGIIENNLIFQTGACGASITRQAPGRSPGRFVGNVLIRTAQNPKYDPPDYYCQQCALALESVPKNFLIADNRFFENRRATPDLPDYDLSEQEFRQVVPEIMEKFRHHPFFADSRVAAFLKQFGKP